jgi:NhaC family Na+:H+ antiporter
MKPLTLGEALLPVAAMLVFFIVGVFTLGTSGELLIVVLLLAAAVAGFIAHRHGKTWDDIQAATGQKFAGVIPVILILLTIGMLIGTWVISGTIPYLVYWGVKVVNPQYLALTAFIATALMSSCTGTSWGSAGTLGVAIMGTATALNAPLPLIAGAVVSGAYFGDKMSPLSDSTNIAAIGANANLYSHIRHMVYTSGPSFVIALIVYALVGVFGTASTGASPEGARVLLNDLNSAFTLHWIVLVPVVIAVWGILRKMSAALAITMSSLAAGIIGVFVQHFSVQSALVATVAGFKATLITRAGVDPAALGADFHRLVERGGLYSMAPTLVVILAAFLLAAGMEVSGALDLLVKHLLASARTVFRLIASTLAAGASMVALTSNTGVTSLVVGELFQQAYRDKGLAPENLSRSIEDSSTITEPLMPWTVSATFMATTLGVPTVAYAPWAVFCYCGPMFSLLIAALYSRTGFGIKQLNGNNRPID